jgi:ribosomal protein S18 acetylase RimI-like enzyme
MGNQNDGIALRMKLVVNINDLLTGSGIQRAGGFVRQNQLGIGDDRPGNGHALLLSAGQFQNTAIRFLTGKPYLFQQLIGFLFLAAFDDGRMIGMARAISDGVSDAYIQDVVVARSHRKQGVGKELILRLQSELEKCGIDWIGLVGAPGTENFYRKIGLVQPGNHTFYQLK